MMKQFFLAVIITSLTLLACTQKSGSPRVALKTVAKAMLDSIINHSDSSYIKPYKRTDFVYAEFYLNKKDSSVCQIMKDSSNTIRQIIVARKNTRTFFAQYYANGQLQADLPLDEFGQYHGNCAYYYEDGNIQSNGIYVHGLKSGQWKNFDANGKTISVDNYDKNGQVQR